MELIIDSREKKMIDTLNNLETKYTVETLDIGDIIIRNNNHNIIIFERKTYKDMLSSLKDGRYKEQKVRLVNELNNKRCAKIFYILEGLKKDIKPFEYNTLLGVHVSCELRDSISILKTENYIDTTNLVIKFFKRLEQNKNNEFSFIFKLNEKINEKVNEQNIETNNQDNLANQINDDYLEKNNINYCDSIKIKKKDNLTPKNCQIASLMVCPGVSSNIATKIINHFGNLNKLFQMYSNILNNKELDTEVKTKNCEELLIDIVVNDNGRKVGKSLSKKIFNNFFNF